MILGAYETGHCRWVRTRSLPVFECLQVDHALVIDGVRYDIWRSQGLPWPGVLLDRPLEAPVTFESEIEYVSRERFSGH